MQKKQITIRMDNHTLYWHTFSGHLKNTMHKMMKTEKLSDVTLVCDDKKILKAHKVVLSASSSVFESIIDDLPQSNSVIYLRGINHGEMEAILKYMYLGEATFSLQRMNEFLSVADSLDIKELSKSIEFNSEEILKTEGSTITDEDYFCLKDTIAEEETCISKDESLMKMDAGEESIKAEVNADAQNESYNYQAREEDNNYTQSEHVEVKYSCSQCSYRALRKKYLRSHIRSIHDGVKYDCNLCDYKATQLGNLRTHVQSKHEGIKIPCNICDQQLNSKASLNMHMKAKHS